MSRMVSVQEARPIEFPGSEVTLAAMDILFENRGRRINGAQLTSMTSEKLGRRVNHAGVIKQIRVFANKQYWNLVMRVEGKRPLALSVVDDVLSQKLHARLHQLYDLGIKLNRVQALKGEQKRFLDSTLANPYANATEIRSKRESLESELAKLISEI